MSDIFDRASEVEDALRQDAIDKQLREAGLQGKTIDDSAESCALCEDVIPEQRRAAIPGVQTCVHCQTELERATAAKGH